MGTPTAERYTSSGVASAKRERSRGVAQHAAGGVGTDLFSADVPTHERPEVIAGQRDPPHIAAIVQHALVVERPMEGPPPLGGEVGF
jgi:hypothetical protein